MKQRKNLKKLLSLIVSAVMLFSVLSIGAMAEDSVPTSDVYTIDAENFKVYVPHNVYMGDFLRAVNSYSSVKTLVDASGNTVFYGTVEDGMYLQVGSTKYEIETNLYSLQDKIKDFDVNEELFDFNSAEDGNTLTTAIQANEKMSKIFNEAKNGTITQSNTYLKVTKKNDAENGDYLEIRTNSQRMLNLTTAYFEDYTEKYPTAEDIVTEMKAIISVAESDTNTGRLTMGHVFNVNNDGTIENIALSNTNGLKGIEDSYVKNGNTINQTLYNSDFVGFRGGSYINMGGVYDAENASSNDIILDKSQAAYTNDSMLNLKQIIEIGEKGATSLDVTGVYFNDTLLTGYTRYSRYKNKTEFNIPLAENVTLNRISAGIIGVGVNNNNSTTYGTESIMKIYDFKVYPAEVEKTVSSDVKLNSSNDKTKNGYDCSYSPAEVLNVMANTTVKELMDLIVFPTCTYSRVSTDGDKSKTEFYVSDDYVINRDGLYLHVGFANLNNGKGYSIKLATVEDATKIVEGTTLTASRECSNTVLGTFVFAAYDSTGKLIETKTTTTADAEGVRSVTFDTPASEIASVKSFVFNNMGSLRPVVDNTAAN